MLEADGSSGDQRSLIDGLPAASHAQHDEQSRAEQNKSFHAILAPLAKIFAVSARDDAHAAGLPSLAAGVVRGGRGGDERHHVREHALPRLRAQHRQLSVLLQRRRRGGGGHPRGPSAPPLFYPETRRPPGGPQLWPL